MKQKQASQMNYSGRKALKSSNARHRKLRDCTQLTVEELVFLANVPGNADAQEELNRRQATGTA